MRGPLSSVRKEIIIFPYLNPSVQVDIPQPDPETRLILNHETGRYVRLGPREYNWLIRLDGRTSQEEIAVQLGMERAFAEEFLRRLATARLILFSDIPVRVTLADYKPPEAAPARVVEWAQFGQLRIRITRAGDLLAKVATFGGFLKNRVFLLLLTCFVLLGLVAAVRVLQVEQFGTALQSFVPSTSRILALIALIFVTTSLHEFGHAVVCTLCGASVRSMGFMIYYLQPAAYADVTESWRLRNKWHRVAISAAGVYVQGIANAIAAIVVLGMRASGRHSTVLLLYIALNLGTMAFNLLPFVKLDGYWMLSAMLGIPNLRDRATEWLQALTASLLTRKPIDPSKLVYTSVLAMTPIGRALLACFGASSRWFGLAMWAGGLSFLFRVSRWIGFGGFRGFFVVGGILLTGGIVFAVRFILARRRSAPAAAPQVAAAPVVARPVVARTSSAFISYDIDRTRPVRINPFAHVLNDGKGNLTFAWVSPDELSIPETPQLPGLLPMLRKGATLREMEEKCGMWDPKTETAIQRLWHSKHLRYSATWDAENSEERYSRQFGWLTFTASVRGSERAVLSRLKKSRVTVLGVGGVGSNVALNLAACGIGELHLVDGDTIELTNLNRQLLYSPLDIGRAKVDVAAERLRLFNPDVRVRTTKAFLNNVGDVADAIQGADFVVRALDTPEEMQIWVNEACVRSGIPSIGAGFLPQSAIIGPMVVPGKTACLACHQTGLPNVNRGIGGTLAPIVATTAGVMANEIVVYLGELGKARTMSGMLLIEAPTFQVRFQEMVRDERCPVCQVRRAVAV